MRNIIMLLSSLLLLVHSASAADLTSQLTQFFQARDAEHAQGMQVVVRTPQNQWPACEAPQFSLPGNSRMWGNISVAANCGQTRRYLQVQVQVSGNYVVVSRQVARGATLTLADLEVKQGRLDTLPARIADTPEQLADAIAMRDLVPGQPITLMMVRQPWRVQAGQNVMVIAQGDGFNASGEGKAMNNATAAQPVRVRMNNGQVVSGRVDPNGNILITL